MSGVSGDAEAPRTWEELEAESRPQTHDPARQRAAAQAARRARRKNIIEWVLAIAGALAVAWLIQAYLIQAFSIPSASMEPTLTNRDRVLVNKRFGDLKRGDVVVFSRPPAMTDEAVDDLIKRIIGLGGDTVEARDGFVLVNGVPIIETYLEPGAVTEDFGPVEVPEDQLFVMGDNRAPRMSFDSRFFGPIDDDLVIGRAFAVVWPVTRWSGI